MCHYTEAYFPLTKTHLTQDHKIKNLYFKRGILVSKVADALSDRQDATQKKSE